MTVNNVVKGARAEKGLTQEDVARLLGISTFSYLKKENGERQFNQSEMVKLSKILDKSLDYLFGEK